MSPIQEMGSLMCLLSGEKLGDSGRVGLEFVKGKCAGAGHISPLSTHSFAPGEWVHWL